MKYKVYFSTSIEVLENLELLGEADTYKEACKIISDHTPENPYWRLLLGTAATFIDFGSWSKFAAIVPAVPTKEIINTGAGVMHKS